MRNALILGFIWLLCGKLTAGEVVIYYWKDAQGKEQYSDTKPKGVDYTTMRLGLYEGYHNSSKKARSTATISPSSKSSTNKAPKLNASVPVAYQSDGTKRDTKAIWREKRPKLCEFYQKQVADIQSQLTATTDADQQAKLNSRINFAQSQARAYCR